MNTIVNSDGYLKAFNTDYTAVFTLIRSAGILWRQPGLRSAEAADGESRRLRSEGRADLRDGIIVARNETAGAAWLSSMALPGRGNSKMKHPGC